MHQNELREEERLKNKSTEVYCSCLPARTVQNLMEILWLFLKISLYMKDLNLYDQNDFWCNFVHELQARKSGAEIMENTENDILKFTIFHSVFQV